MAKKVKLAGLVGTRARFLHAIFVAVSCGCHQSAFSISSLEGDGIHPANAQETANPRSANVATGNWLSHRAKVWFPVAGTTITADLTSDKLTGLLKRFRLTMDESVISVPKAVLQVLPPLRFGKANHIFHMFNDPGRIGWYFDASMQAQNKKSFFRFKFGEKELLRAERNWMVFYEDGKLKPYEEARPSNLAFNTTSIDFPGDWVSYEGKYSLEKSKTSVSIVASKEKSMETLDNFQVITEWSEISVPRSVLKKLAFLHFDTLDVTYVPTDVLDEDWHFSLRMIYPLYRQHPRNRLLAREVVEFRFGKKALLEVAISDQELGRSLPIYKRQSGRGSLFAFTEDVTFSLRSYARGSEIPKSHRLTVTRENIRMADWISSERISKRMEEYRLLDFTFSGDEIQSHVGGYVAELNGIDQKVTGTATLDENKPPEEAEEECSPSCLRDQSTQKRLERAWRTRVPGSMKLERDPRSGYYLFTTKRKDPLYNLSFEVFTAYPPSHQWSKEFYLGYCRHWGLRQEVEHAKCPLKFTWVPNHESEADSIFQVEYTLPLANIKHHKEVANFIKAKLASWIKAGEASTQ